MLTDLEKQIISQIQGDLPICQRPYRPIADGLGIPEEKLLEHLRDLNARGVIRRFGATLRHQKSGFAANAMCAWQVPEAREDEVGAIMAAFSEVTHCYRRTPTDRWPYNLYAMIHGGSRDDCRRIARRIAERTGIDAYTLLFSHRELKKTSMEYFPVDDEC